MSEQSIFIDERQLAERQCRSVKTLRNQRVVGGGIPFVKMGRSVRYRLADVLEWERIHTVENTSQAICDKTEATARER